MDFGLGDKVAMVAASSRGIGLAVAKALTLEGCRVSICARDEERLEAAAAEIGEETRSYVVDVSNIEDLKWWHDQTVEDLGPASILVTNTGGPAAGPLDELTDEQWQQGVEGTLMNVVRLVRMVEDDMKSAKWGRIVHISSFVAKEPSGILPISSTLRAGLAALIRVQSDLLAPFGITVNGVLPGHTMTDRQTHLAQMRAEKSGSTIERELEMQAASTPVRRLAEASEIADVVAFLCSANASYVCGVNLLVDGGLTRCIA